MKKRIPVNQLQLGMYVEELDRPWLGTPFLLEGVPIRTEEDIQTLQSLCQHVYITVGADIQDQQAPQRRSRVVPNIVQNNDDVEQRLSRKRLAQFGQVVEKARTIHKKNKVLVDTMHDDIIHGRNVDTKGAKLMVSDMVENVMHDPDALLWLTHLKNRDEYTALHSMNVSVLSIVFGSHLGLNKNTLEQLGLGALLHDMGKLRIPLDVLNKPARLTDKEFDLIKKHPVYGVHILQQSKGIDRNVLDVVLSHHERVNGQGYPRKLAPDKITFFSKVVAIVDAYDALTSTRVYKPGMPTPKAMKLLDSVAGTDFDPHLVQQFVQCLGSYPSGSLVVLMSGEVGLVIPSNREQQSKPIVLLILDAQKKKYYPLKIVDYRLVQNRSERQIRQVLKPGTHGIYAHDYAQEISAMV